MLGNALEHVTQIRLQVDIVEFGCSNESADCGGAFVNIPKQMSPSIT
jgi:hypothetical protein